MKKLFVAVVMAFVVALGLVTATGGAAMASVVTNHHGHQSVAFKHGPGRVGFSHHGRSHHRAPQHHKKRHHHGRHHHQPYPGTVKTHPLEFFAPFVPAGNSAYVVDAIAPFFATGTLTLSVTGNGVSDSTTDHVLVTEPLQPGVYTVTTTFTPQSGSVFAPSSTSRPLFVFPTLAP